MGAMPEEIDALLAVLERRAVRERAGRTFHAGRLHGHEVVIVFSRWGKVASASTVTELILEHDVGSVVFFGIAGGVNGVARGDVVVATGLVQHDLDASPFFPPLHVPMLGIAELPVDETMSKALARGAERFVVERLRADAPTHLLEEAALGEPRVRRGVIASGDQVIFSSRSRDMVRARAPEALCVEMEGAAVAQVCHEHHVPFACVRTISDVADDQGGEHVKPFLHGLAGVYTKGIVAAWLGA
jgi:adenosylhomocysteine nucleosidase